MQRREFLGLLAAAAIPVSPALAYTPGYGKRLLVLVELKGGNDGLNTVVPYADPAYASLRPRLALPRDQLLQLDEHSALHPALREWWPLWQAGELAIVQSVGYERPNLSHFRSIEIWDTASGASEFLQEGWLARLFARTPPPADALADGVAIGGSEMGPLAGARAIALRDADQFRRQSRLAQPGYAVGNNALRHIMQVENDVSAAGRRIEGSHVFRTTFPRGEFGQAVSTACQVVASGGVVALRLTLGSFDTHQNQAGTHANLLGQLAEGLLALRSGLQELGRWSDTLVMTYAEFGRRPKQNQSNGTDHGTAAPHFVLGGRVRGGLYGARPALDRLDGNGNLPFAVDFRSLYATAIEGWWGLPAAPVLGGRFKPLPLLA